MPDGRTHVNAFYAFATRIAKDPQFEEQKRRLWALTPDQRVEAMRAGRLSFRICQHWASLAPHEVPLLNGEFEFIAVETPEVAECDAASRGLRSRNGKSIA